MSPRTKNGWLFYRERLNFFETLLVSANSGYNILKQQNVTIILNEGGN
jgi:hypothetical protein